MNDKQHKVDDEAESMANVPSAPTSDASSNTSAGTDLVNTVASASNSDKKLDYECARQVGEHLARLREEKHWVLEDIAAQLKVSSAKLHALETGELNKLPGTAFAVGLLRAYAKLLGIDATPLIQELHNINGLFKTELSGLGMQGGNLPSNHELVIWRGRLKKRRVWIVSIALALICFALFFGSTSLHGLTDVTVPRQDLIVPPPTNETKPVAQQEPALIVPPAASSVPATAPVLASSALTTAPVPASAAPAPVSQSGQAQQPSTPLSSVHFKASEENWVKVSQRDGKEIYSGVLNKDEEHTVQGLPPFKVIVGNQAGLEFVELDGTRVAASKYAKARQNKVVHFDLP